MSVLFTILFVIMLLSFIVGLIKPKWFDKGFKGGASRKKISAIFGVPMFLFLIIAAMTSGGNSKSANAPAQPDMNLAISQSYLGAATGLSDSFEPVIKIKNLNTFDWKNCDISMNDTYKAHLDSINIPSEIQKNPSDVKDSMIVTERNFFKSDGTRFDYSKQAPLKISVLCLDPYVGTYEGDFKH